MSIHFSSRSDRVVKSMNDLQYIDVDSDKIFREMRW